MGRRLGKQLQKLDLPLVVFLDIDPHKIGRQKRGVPVVAFQDLPLWWERYKNPAILVAVGARRARGLIRERLVEFGFVEGRDWWAAT